ncbi:MAG TPA: DUF1854 domain-containing protein [Firmicutes bacterium]|nr:DUF1854 domain-containing protein [Bacillota bacterium]
MSDLKYLDLTKARFRTTAGGLLSLELADELYPKVDIHLAFPFTFPNRFISVRLPDDGEEIGLIKDLNGLDEVSKKAVQEEIQWRYYTPKIERIKDYKEEFGHAYWDVVTDRGEYQFVTRGRDRTIRRITARRTLIMDVSGNRFEIEDLAKLDAKSRQYLETLL